MSHATRVVLAAVLAVAASSAHAFTIGDPSTTPTYGSQGGSNYGGTLSNPGNQASTYRGLDLSTPNTSTTTTPQEGFSLRFGAGPTGSDTNRRLAPPAWSTDPLYLERDH